MATYWLTRERIPKVTTQAGSAPTLENKLTKLPSTPIPSNVRRGMANKALNSSDNFFTGGEEAGVPLLAITPSSDDSNA